MALPISQGSGATLASNVFDGAHHQIISPVSLYPLPAGSNFIGLISAASIHGKVDVATALPAGANYIGLTTAVIGNTPAVSQSGTWNVGVTGLISLASGTLVGLNPGANFIGLATVVVGNSPSSDGSILDGTVSSIKATVLSTASGNPLTAILKGKTGNTVDANASGALYTQHIGSLPAGANYLGLATVDIGSIPTVTVNTHAVTQSGNWNVTSLASGAHINAHLQAGTNNIGDVDVASIAAGANYIGLASVNIGGGNVGITGALPAGANFIGLATVVIGAGTITGSDGAVLDGVDSAIKASVLSLASGYAQVVALKGKTGNTIDANASGAIYTQHIGGLPAGSNFLGGVSVFGSLSANLAGNVTLNPSPNFIGLISAASIHGKVDIATALPAGGNYIGLATVWMANKLDSVNDSVSVMSLASGAHINTYTQNATPSGTNFIGLATAVIGNTPLVSLASGFGPMKPISTYTSLATVVSAAGNATLFVPPSGQRWIMKDLEIGALGRGVVEIKSGANTLIPAKALATTSGVVAHYGDSGLRAKAADESFVVNVVSAATLSVMANVRFE